jgi:very-short-patch-repair endonuclease
MSKQQSPETPDAIVPDAGETPWAAPTGATSEDHDRRSAIVERAAKAWASQIIDLGGRNNLLFYRDLKVGTIDLTPSEQVAGDAVRRLLDGRSTRLSALVASDELPAYARRGRTIRRKADENYEERGLQTLFVANGMATWDHALSQATPAAPVVLAPLRLAPRGGAAEDFDLDLDGDWEVNPTLLHLLRVDFGTDIDADELLRGKGGSENAVDPLDVHGRIVERCAHVPGFTIDPRVVAGNFSYAKQPLALDIAASIEAMARHPVVSAIAGDPKAQQELIESQPVADISEPDHTAPADEFLILDADASQSYVVNTAVRGANLVVQGPPGTGKSQTIANLIATLSARGLSTLFVAEKRAAIDAVTKRLVQTGLDSLVMDLRGGTGSRRSVLQQVARALDTIGNTPVVDRREGEERLVHDRDRLNSFDESLHRPRGREGRGGEGPSVYEMQSELLGISDEVRSESSIPRPAVEAIDWDRLLRIEADVADWVRLGGPSLGDGAHPWEAAAGRITSTEQAEHALGLTQQLATATVDEAAAQLETVATECALRRPRTIAEWEVAMALVAGVDDTLHRYDPGIYDADLERLANALAPAGKNATARGAAAVFNGRYRRARTEVWALARADRTPADLLADIERIRDPRSTWTREALDHGLPRVPPSFGHARTALGILTSQLNALAAFVGDDHRRDSFDEVRLAARALLDDRATLFSLPRLSEIRRRVDGAGLGSALDEADARQLGADDAALLVRSVWLRSMLDVAALADPDIGTFDGSAHTDLAVDFARHDRSHIDDGGPRVLRRAAERAVIALNAHPEQAQLLRQQAGRRRGHLSLRELLTRAPDVLMAVKPCWAMSPLIVSQVLPNDPPLFDFVIFDEASQIPPAEAVPAVLRGRQLIVAGDSRQLPPTTFFATTVGTDDENDGEPDDENDGEPDDENDGQRADRVTDDMESILDSMVAMLPPPHGSKTLAWHYRSRDERLITFSNAQPSLYDWTMTTFPGLGTSDAIRHIEVPWDVDSVDPGHSGTEEVQVVVDLVAEHARTTPNETLGVIGMGIRHADRIAEGLRLERQTDATLDAFLAAHPDEPFFVKNLERVQGDERDDVIITIGYGRNADGKMVYRFGPLNQPGGERRLNVAITRARERVTIVSSFGPDDLDDDRLHAEGAKMLKRYLSYAASGGAELGAVARSNLVLNPFESDVLHHLTEAGMPVTPHLGISGHRIDFAVAHPDEPGRHLLAIEADGSSYHASATARDRDRLRQEHLERLGWRFHRIWSTEWFRNRDAEVERAAAAWRDAVAEADGRPAGLPTTGTPQPPSPEGDTIGTATHGDIRATASDVDPVGPERRLPRPNIRTGESITAYSDRELDAIVEWIRSDTLLRTDEELLDTTVKDLGYRRKGSRIVAAIESAIERTRPAAPPTGLAPPTPPDRPESATATRPLSGRLSPPAAPGSTAGWFPDPTGRFDHRYWDGERWTEHAGRGGKTITDHI